MNCSKFLTAVKTAQHDAKTKIIFSAIIPAFNKVHTAKTPSELREWLNCYSTDVTVILITPALIPSEQTAMQHFFRDTLKEIEAIENELTS